MNQASHVREFDPSLIARYDTQGPRYTSYPTVPHFRGDFDGAALRSAIQRSNDDLIPAPLSLYVHVPFCRSPCFYCGCNRVITRDLRKADHYLERLFREISLTAPLFDRDRTVRQLHIGGGTPNFLALSRMRDMMKSLARHFHVSVDSKSERGIEVDPRFADENYIQGLAELGFNRLSLGIQDFDPAVQGAVNRVHEVEHVQKILERAHASGFDSVNVDLIYGLPKQTPEGFDRTIAAVIALNPDRVAMYGYAHLPETFKVQRHIKAIDLPSTAVRMELFGRALERLGAAGYVYIGMDHFARADDELVRAQRAGTLQRNFQGYSTHGDCDIVGLGVSAISRIGDSYSQNTRVLGDYHAMLDAGKLPVARGLVLDADDILRRELINELMCHGALDKSTFGKRHTLIFDDYFAADLGRLKVLAADGLVKLENGLIRVTERGRFLLRNIAMCFDKYLVPGPQAATYSRTI